MRFSPNNLTQMWRYVRGDQVSGHLGLDGGLRLMTHLMLPHTDDVRLLLAQRGGLPFRPVGGLLILAFVVLAVRLVRGQGSDVDRLIAATALGAVAGLAAMASIQSERMLIYAALFIPVTLLAVGLLLAVCGGWLLERSGCPSPNLPRKPQAVFGLGVLLLAAMVVPNLFLGLLPTPWETGRDTHAAGDAVVRQLGRTHQSGRVRIDASGPAGLVQMSSGIGYRLRLDRRDFTQRIPWTLPTDDEAREDQHAPQGAVRVTIREYLMGRWSVPVPSEADLVYRRTRPPVAPLPSVQVEVYVTAPG